METGKTGKYLKYAIGEIILVVIGILIALQINNWNETRKIRATEVLFLENIKADLELNLVALDSFIKSRKKAIESSNIILDIFENRRPLNLNEFNLHSLDVMIWFPFQQNDNTYQELVNSGQLSIISNKDIKDHLQNIQSNLKTIAFVESEMQQDFESYMYDEYFTLVDLNATAKNYFEQTGKGAITTKISEAEVLELLKNRTFKNAFVLSNFNSNLLLEEYSKTQKTTKNLIALIDTEIKN